MCRWSDRILNYSHPEPVRPELAEWVDGSSTILNYSHPEPVRPEPVERVEGSNEIQATMPTDRTLQVQETSPNTLQEYCHPEFIFRIYAD